MKEIQSSELTPEQLLQLLDAQMAIQRSHRARTGRNRATILMAGVLFIMAVAAAALLVLNQMLMDRRDGGRASNPVPVSSPGKI